MEKDVISFSFSGRIALHNVSVRAIGLMWTLAVIEAVGCGHWKRTESKPPVPEFADAVAHQRALTRAQTLKLALGKEPYARALLLRGVASPDLATRIVAATQLGELGPAEIDATVVSALLGAAGDDDAELAHQALAALLRVARMRPDALLLRLSDHSPLRRFQYESVQANGRRVLPLLVSDVAIAGLYYAPPMQLDAIVHAFAQAKGTQPGRGDAGAADEDPLDEGAVDFRAYYASALSLLLERDVDARHALLEGLLASEHRELRAVAYRAAAQVTIGREAVKKLLLAAVHDGPTQADREEAAGALAALSDDARADLRTVASAGSVDERAAALAALLPEADCAALLPVLAQEHEPRVREAGLHAVLETSSRELGECLVPFVADTSLSLDLRTSIFERLRPHDHPLCRACTPAQIDQFFESLRPALESGPSRLSAAAWQTLGALSARSAQSDQAALAIASTRLRQGALQFEDEPMLCALAGVDVGVLSADRALLAQLVHALGSEIDGFSHCVARTLSKVDPKSDRAGFARSVIKRYFASKQVSDADRALLVSDALREELASQWRRLAHHLKGTNRLTVYRIVAARGLDVTQSVALFRAVLDGDVRGVGENGGSTPYERRHELRWRLMPEAVEGLREASAQGHQILSDILRGKSGSAEGREAVMFPMYNASLSPQEHAKRAREFAEDLAVVARDDANPEMRARATTALVELQGERAPAEIIRALFKDQSSSAIDEIARRLTRDHAGLDNALDAAEVETLALSMLNSPAARTRAGAVHLIAALGSRLPDEFVERVVARMLRDADQETQREALLTLHELGPGAVTALVHMLEQPAVEGKTLPRLPQALIQLGARSNEVLPALMAMHRRAPESVEVVHAIAATQSSAPEVLAMLESLLSSEVAQLRAAALSGLSRRGPDLRENSPYLAALVVERTQSEVKERIGRVLEHIRPYRGGVPLVYHVPPAAHFALPLPPATLEEPLSASALGSSNASLKNVVQNLASGVRPEHGPAFEIQGTAGGFLIADGLERVAADGTRARGCNGWSESVGRVLSFEDYLLDLFMAAPGEYRANIVTVGGSDPLRPHPGGDRFELGERTTLSPEVQDLPLGSRRVRALVYAFERLRGGRVSAVRPGSASTRAPFAQSMLWQSLQALSAH